MYLLSSLSNLRDGDLLSSHEIVRQLDMTFTAIGGFHLGSVKFLGITFLPINESGSVTLSSRASESENELFLVFERASEGTLLDFVEQKMRNTSGEESWIFILDNLSAIARGLANLHHHKIIHG
jgi:serine/threonine protein kinase